MAQKFNESLSELRALSNSSDAIKKGEQSGDGVLTRNQAKQAALSNINHNTNSEIVNLHSNTKTNIIKDSIQPNPTEELKLQLRHDPRSEHEPEFEPESNFEPGPQLELKSPKEKEKHNQESSPLATATSNVNDHNSYLEEKLVAENSDLKAFIIKTHFRRMKNFM